MPYRASLRGVLVLTLASVVASCDNDRGVDFDRAAPTVISTTPAAGATGVARNATVTATFSEPAASSSLTTTTFTVTPAGGAAVAGAVATSGSTATFTPAAPLAFGQNGVGGAQLGTLSASGYVPANGTDGTSGTPGTGGGGGAAAVGPLPARAAAVVAVARAAAAGTSVGAGKAEAAPSRSSSWRRPA